MSKKEIENLIDEFIFQAISLSCHWDLFKSCIYDEGFKTLKIIVKELLLEENCHPYDFRLIGTGSDLVTYMIGSKVLKISKPKSQKNVPISKYNVQLISDVVDIGGLKVQFEIMQYLLPLDKTELTEEEKENIVYELYKGYRKEGLVWADPKTNNVGMLVKDNLLYLDSIAYLKLPEEMLKAGSYANFDVEYIYTDKDFSYTEIRSKINTRYYMQMEERYQAEKKS